MDERTYQDIIDDADVAQFFPKLVGNYRKTSPATLRYNCLAWALRIDWLWFQHEARTAGYYWPPGIEREWSISSIRKILEVHGYAEEAGNAEVESGYEKVAFYVDRSNEPTHFARQFENGKWTSKLGDLVDIEHDDLECLEGDEQYGSVLCILKRRIVSLT